MNRSSRITALFLILALLLTLIPAEQTEAAKKVTVGKVTVASKLSKDTKTVVVAKGKKVSLETVVTVTPDKASNKKVSYSSKNKKIATVSSKGVVKGIKAGTTKVTVTSKKNKKKKATITVKVYKGAVTKVAFAKTSGKLDVDKKETLTPTVSAKSGACKTLYWSSSDEKVATVNSKGEITAKAKGKTTIQAQAIDGSGKKASYELTVEDPIYLTKVEVVNPQTITFSLNKAYPLKKEAVSVASRSSAKGKYVNNLTVEELSTSNNINYTITLGGRTGVEAKQYARVSVPSLSGPVKIKEAFYTGPLSVYTDEHASYWHLGEYKIESFSFEEGEGMVSYSISKLPAGLTSSTIRGKLYIKGTPTKAGRVDAVLTAVDELGNKKVSTIYFLVGSVDVMVGYADTTYKLFYDGMSFVEGEMYKIYSHGGEEVNRVYTTHYYEIIKNPGNIASLPDEKEGRIKYKIPAVAGTYNVVVRIYEDVYKKKYCDVTVPIVLEKGIEIKGCVKDIEGKMITDEYDNGSKMHNTINLEFTNQNKGARYDEKYTVTADENGNYQIRVPKGTYDVHIELYHFSRNYVRDQIVGSILLPTYTNYYCYGKIFTNSQTCDFKIPYYKVTLTAGTGQKIDFNNLNWIYNNEYLGCGNIFYMKKGSHSLWATETKEEVSGGKTYRVTYRYTATFQINNTSVKPVVVRSVIKRELVK